MKCIQIVRENVKLKLENEILRLQVKILKDAIDGALIKITDIRLEDKVVRDATQKSNS